MAAEPTPTEARRFEFVPTEAVLASRAQGQFIACPVCDADSERYLFTKTGARFVRCRSCGLVYANPPPTTDRNYFDVDAAGQHERPADRALFQTELTEIIESAVRAFENRRAQPVRQVVLAGRTLSDGPDGPAGVGELRVVRMDAAEVERLTSAGDVAPIRAQITESTDVLVLNEVLEACARGSSVVQQLVDALPEGALVVVVFSNVRSLPARAMRRYWPRFFAWKSVYFDADNLARLMDRAGLRQVAQERRVTPYTAAYALERVGRPSTAALLRRVGLGSATVRLPAGTWVAMFEKPLAEPSSEMLSVVVPVFNEATYVGPVLEALLAKQVSIPKEVIVVESNSTDGTREIVRSFEGRPGLRVVYEDEPSGKGAAVRRGLAAAAGSVFIIQDADFEYDLDDYDALLEPILQRRTSFVLGSRSLGLDDWKVRRYASSRIKAFLMNFAQVLFAHTFNLLYQQKTTDVNTMFKVFRRECIEGLELVGNGFNFDIELVCMIVANGFSPMEVPVNYVARGFDEGKKINFLTDFFPSYAMFYRCRFRRPTPRTRP
jgi:hypothetical protein